MNPSLALSLGDQLLNALNCTSAEIGLGIDFTAAVAAFYVDPYLFAVTATLAYLDSIAIYETCL
jgi:hypothetical protein